MACSLSHWFFCQLAQATKYGTGTDAVLNENSLNFNRASCEGIEGLNE